MQGSVHWRPESPEHGLQSGVVVPAVMGPDVGPVVIGPVVIGPDVEPALKFSSDNFQN